MSTAEEPGAPTKPSVDRSQDPSAPKDVQKVRDKLPPHVVNKATSTAQKLDRLILRLNKLFASPGGISSFLQTFNYTLFLVAYLQTKTPSLAKLSQTLLGLLNYKRQETISEKLGALNTTAVPGAPSSVASLATLLSQTRTTLRLFGLFPLYAWMRTLLQGPKEGQDSVLYGIAFTQCTGYICFQFLENLALLTDHGVVPKSFSARYQGGVSNSARIYLWSYRAWLVGVSCDFLRLGREAQLTAAKRTGKSTSEKSLAEVKEDVEAQDAKWWNELMVPTAWLPVALHCSKEGGIPGMNLGIMGACGVLAGLGRTSGLWAQTSDV